MCATNDFPYTLRPTFPERILDVFPDLTVSAYLRYRVTGELPDEYSALLDHRLHAFLGDGNELRLSGLASGRRSSSSGLEDEVRAPEAKNTSWNLKAACAELLSQDMLTPRMVKEFSKSLFVYIEPIKAADASGEQLQKELPHVAEQLSNYIRTQNNEHPIGNALHLYRFITLSWPLTVPPIEPLLEEAFDRAHFSALADLSRSAHMHQLLYSLIDRRFFSSEKNADSAQLKDNWREDAFSKLVLPFISNYSKSISKFEYGQDMAEAFTLLEKTVTFSREQGINLQDAPSALRPLSALASAACESTPIFFTRYRCFSHPTTINILRALNTVLVAGVPVDADVPRLMETIYDKKVKDWSLLDAEVCQISAYILLIKQNAEKPGAAALRPGLGSSVGAYMDRFKRLFARAHPA